MQELKLKTRRVLEAVYNNGGEAITPEIEEQTGIEKSATLRYHAEDVLEERGLVECRVESTEDHPTGVRHVEITEEGRERIGQLFDGTDDVPISKRMNRIEERFDETESHVTELIGEIREVEQTAEMGYDQSEKAVKVAAEGKKSVQQTAEELRTEIQKVHEEAFEDRGDIHGKINTLEREVEQLRGLDARISEIEDKLDRLDIPEPEESEESEESEEADETTESEEKEDLSDEEKVAQVTRYFDEKSRDNRHWSRSHAKKRFDEKFGYRDRIYRKAIKKTKMKL